MGILHDLCILPVACFEETRSSTPMTLNERAVISHACLVLADDVDIALLRRFHSRIFVGPPNATERMEMLSAFLAGIDHTITLEQLSTLADRLIGWTGSDIKVPVYAIPSSVCLRMVISD